MLWKLQAHVHSLKAVDVKGTEYGVILTLLVLSCLPQDIRMEWAREGEGKEPDLSWFMESLQKEIQRRERSSTFKESGGSGGASAMPDVSMDMRRKPATAIALCASSESASGCGFCGGRHPSDWCVGVLAVSIPERKQKVQSSGLCFKCLSKTHIAKQGLSKCAKYKGAHNVIICSSSGNTSAGHEITPDSSNTQTVVKSGGKDDTSQTSNTTSAVGVVLDITKVFSSGQSATLRSWSTQVFVGHEWFRENNEIY